MWHKIPTRLMFHLFKKTNKFLHGTGLGKLPGIQSTYWFLYRHLKPSGIVLIEVHGHKMYLDPLDRITSALFFSDVYEKYQTNLFISLVKRGMVVVDIGAHIGYYTLLAADLVGEEGKVFAFEPNPDSYTLLVKNIEINGYNNIFPVQKAISNKTGSAKLFLGPHYNRGDSRLYDSHDGRESIEVDVTTLDSYFGKDCQVDLIKMDIQGAEAGALQGMANVIEKNDNLKLITEYWPAGLQRFGSSPMDFLDKLMEHGFKLYHVDERGQRICPISAITSVTRTANDEEFTNLFCEKGQ